MELLSIAYTLSLLTYSLGAVLYGSPIPLKSVKRWGILMMYDSLASAVLISIYSLILKLGDYLLEVLGVSWPYFTAWLTGRTASLVTSYLALQSIATALRASGADVLLELVKHISSLIATSLTAIKMIYIISAVVYTLRDKILALGVLLYSTPLRIGKSVGAAMIAISIVYYVGLPLMPSFAYIFETPTPLMTNDKYGSLDGVVTDILGKPIPYPVVRLYKNSRTPVAVTVGDEEGRFHIGPPQSLVQRGEIFEFEVVFMGYKVRPEPHRVEVPWSGELRVYSILYLGEGLALMLVGIFELSISSNTNTPEQIELSLNVVSGEVTLSFLRLSSVNVSEISINTEGVSCRWDSFSWNELEIEECRMQLNTGAYIIRVAYTGASYLRPHIDEKNYINISDIADYLGLVQTVAVSYLYSYLLLPSTYLIALSTASFALSRFIGGGLRLRIV